MTVRPYLGVILAGGRGVRMEPFSTSYPKPLLPVLDRPVIAHQIDQMRAVGIDEIVVVVGHLGRAIADALGDGSSRGVRIAYVEQGEPHGIAHAVARAEPHVDRPFLLTLGDIFFVAEGLERTFRAMEQGGLGAVLAVRREPDVDAVRRNFAVVLTEEGLVKRVIEKPHHPPTRLKGCGIYLFGLPIFDAIRRTPRSALRDEFELTDSIQIFIDDEHRVGAEEVVLTDVNLTYPRDLWSANIAELERQGLDALVADDATVGDGAVIRRSVIGAGAHVAPGVRVEDAVVFAGTRVDHDAIGCVVTPESRVTFRGPA